jgi:type II secretory pathway pseudopilin PulG
VELLVVLGIIAILVAIAAPLVPSLLRANQLDSSVNTLAGILEEARESATAGNTYIWVVFTDPSATSPATGTWVATIQSQDGTETGIVNPTPPPPWVNTISVPGTTANLILHSKLQNLPGVGIVQLNKLPASLTSPANTKVPTGAYDLILTESSLQWVVTTSASTGLGSNVYFTHAIEFTPNGESHAPAWNSNIQFGLVPSVGPTTNSALFNVSRLTGKTTIFRM